jgi:hypothetical protein
MKKLVKKIVVVLMVFGLASSVMAVPITTGLVVQMDMSSVATDGLGNVTAWNDLTSNNNDALQATSGLQPVLVSNATPNGSSAVKFDGTDDYLSIVPNSTLDGGTWTMIVFYAVDTFDSGSGSRRVINLGYADINPAAGTTKSCNTTYTMIVGSGTVGVRSTSRDIAAGGKFVSSGIPAGYATDTFYTGVATMDYVSTNATAYLFDQAGNVTTAASVTGANAVGSGNNLATIGCGTVGLSNPAPGSFFNGWASEILIYNRVLTSQEMTSVDEYLNAKYITPEPATISLLVMGVMGLFVRRSK